MDFVIPEKKKTKITIYGQEYMVSKPTVEAIEAMGNLDKLTDLEKISASKEMVSKLGIPKEVLDGLEINHFTMLMEYLTSESVKKN